jgi:CRP-like cAMP-binding protein
MAKSCYICHMSYEAIHQYLRTCTALSDAQLAHFDQFFVQKSVPADQFLLRAGEVCAFEAFVLKGCIKTYYIDKQGKELILTFATENWWVSDIMSFQEQTPGKMFIQTLEPCELLLLTPQSKARLLADIPELERMFRLMVQRHLGSIQERLFGFVGLSARERYAAFLEKYPHLPQRIPQYLIAAYLGITPEFLSRLRTSKRVS